MNAAKPRLINVSGEAGLGIPDASLQEDLEGDVMVNEAARLHPMLKTQTVSDVS
jgi:hypothetical protein